MIVAKVVATMQTKTPTTAATESTMDPYWGTADLSVQDRRTARPARRSQSPEDTIAPELAALRREQTALRAGARALKNRKTTTRGQAGGQRGTDPTSRACAHVFISHAAPKDAVRRSRGPANLCLGARDLPAVRGRDEDE